MQERQCYKNCCPQQNTTQCSTQNNTQNSTQTGATGCQPQPQSKYAYALYYQLDEITVAANDSVDFPLTAAESSGDFLSDGNQIQILKPGVYHVVYTVNVPAAIAVTTTFALQANRQNVAGTERAVATTATTGESTVTAETILTVCSPISIRVVSTAAATITGAEDEVLATLFIHQLA